MKLKLLVCLLLFVGALGFGQSIFENPILGTNPNTANPYTTGQVVNPNITVSGIGRGAGINGNNANDRYNANGWDTVTIDLNAYFEFIITPNVDFEIDFLNFQYTSERSGTGPISFAFRSSVDGYSANIGTPTATGVTINLSNATYQNITGPITFRLYGWGASGAGGTFSVNNFTFNGIVNSTSSPNINISPASITSLDYIIGNGPSAEQTFTVSGTNLTNDISLTAPANFEISTSTGGGFGPNITLPQTGGNVANTTIYTRLVSGLANGNYTGNINATSIGATAQNVAVSGTVIADVLITEIMYDTPGPNDLEWIEICNLTVSAQNIANYRIGVNGTTRFTFPAGANVPANACITVRIGHVASSPAPECPFTPTYSNPIGTTDILVNTGRTITLLAANGISIADAVAYNPTDGGNGNGSTLHVIDATQDNSNTNNGNWTQVSNGGSPGVNTIISPCAVQNIVVRGDIGSFPTIANGDTTPQGTDNTQFAAQTIGNSQDKTYRVANEGSLPLTISSIALSGDTADFTITQFPTFNLAIGTFDILEITFAPTVAGERNATVTITSDDPDTPVYTFAIRGTGNCAISSPTLSPTSGPVGTIVTLTGENFGGSTTLTYQGNSVAVTVISATQLEFEIPAGAGSGVAAFTNNIGCQGTAVFTVLNNTIATCEGSAGSAPGDLFISEVTDATFGGLTYVEIFNATGAPVALVDYAIQVFSNGSSTPQYTLNLNAVTLSNLDTYVIAIGMSTSNCSVTGGDGLLANQSTTQAGVNVVSNEHDMIRLVKNGASIIVDEFGVYEDENWMDATIVTGDRGFNFRRLNTAGALPRVPFNLTDWEVIDWAGTGSTTCQTNNDYSNIGVYDFSLGIPPTVSTPVLSSTNCLEATITVTANEGFVGGNPLAYQWFTLAPGDTTWTALTDIGVYTGTDTNTLTINNTFNLNNYQYYCEVRENTATCSQASDAVRIEIEQTIWDGTDWNNGLPTGSTLVIIEGNYDTSVGGIQGSFSACNLIINGGTVNIADGDYIEVYNSVSIESTAAIPRLRVQPQGAFVQVNDNGTVTGDARINKLTAPMDFWYEYTYWSSPVSNANVGTTLFQSNANRRFWFNAQNYRDSFRENNNDNIFVVGQDDIDDDGDDWTLASAAEVMIPGRGYAATLSPIAFIGGPGSQYQFNFDGVMNNGIIPVPVYRNDGELNDNNWNFIGNPYPSAISADLFLATNTALLNQNVGALGGAIFLWSQNTDASATTNGNENQNFAQADYAIINGSGNAAGGDGVTPNNFIPSGQGFFVAMANSATATNIGGTIWEANVLFNNSMRVTGNNDQFFRSQNVAEPDKLWLNLTSDNGVFNQMLVAYVEGATNADDGMFYDAPRNLATGTYASLYSTIDNSEKRFAIQGKEPNSLRTDEIISLGFANSITVPTVFKISVAQLQGDFMSNNTVYLKDNLLNLTHDLTRSEYHFTAEVGEFNQRFEIVFNRESLSIGDQVLNSNDLAIIEFPNGEVQFIVSQQHQIKEVTIVDLMGRVVCQLKGNHHTETYDLSQLSKAAYIAKVTLANGQTLQKKAVKRF